MPSLDELEKHIEQNGTLPGIPAEAAVIKNGIELGEMNKKLLAKIEELTLYLIRQNKAIKTLYRQNQNQQKQIDRLKTQTKK